MAAQTSSLHGVAIEISSVTLPAKATDEASAGYHGAAPGGNQSQVAPPEGVPDEISRQLAHLGVNLNPAHAGRKNVFDDFLRGRLVSLLAMGFSLRQAGSALGLSHVAVWKEMNRNPDLSEQVNAARFQAQIGPLAVILRESKRSWRAATWLMNYLQKQVRTRDETPDEENQRRRAEAAEVNQRIVDDQNDLLRRMAAARQKK